MSDQTEINTSSQTPQPGAPQSDSSREQSGERRGKRRRWPWLCGGLLVLLVAFFLFLPLALEWTAEWWLRDQGNKGAQIGGLWFNPVTGRLNLESVLAGKGEEEHLDLENADVRVDWLPLIRKRFYVENVVLKDVLIDIVQQPDGTLVVGGLVFEPMAEEGQAPPPEEEAKPWGLGIGAIDLENVRFRIIRGELDVNFLVKNLHVDPMQSWEPDVPTPFVADLEINEGIFRFTGTMRPFHERFSLNTRVEIIGYQLGWLAALLQEMGITRHEGLFGMTGTLVAGYEPVSDEASLLYGGSIYLTDYLFVRETGETVRFDALGINGEIRAQLGPGGESYEGLIAGDILLEGFGAQTPDVLAGWEKLAFNGDVEASQEAPEAPIGLLADVKLEMKGVRGDAAGWESRLAGLAWTAHIDLETEPDASRAEGEVRTSLILAGLDAAGPELALDARGLTLTADVDVGVHREEAGMRLALEGELGQETDGLALPGLLLAHVGVGWKGNLTANQAEESLSTLADGRLEVTELDLGLDAPPVRVTQDKLAWEGRAGLEPALNGESVALAAGALSLENVGLLNGEATRLLAGFEILRLDEITLKGPDDISFKALRLDGFEALQRDPPSEETAQRAEQPPDRVVRVGAVKVDGVRVTGQQRAEVKAVTVRDLTGWVVTGEEGELEFLSWLPTASEATGNPAQREAVAPKPKESGASFTVKLDSFKLEGDNRLVYEDRSLFPDFHIDLHGIRATLDSVDTGAPDTVSELDLFLNVDEHGKVELEARAAPLADKVDGEARLAVDGFDLAPLTAYSQRHIGYRLVSGSMDLDTQVTVAQGIVNAANDLHLALLEMEPLREDQKDEYTEELGIPVGLALALLKDRDGDIVLDVPIEGDLADPEFGVGSAVGIVLQKALLGAVKVAAVAYFAPLGALFAAGAVLDLATALQFDPVVFPPGESALSEGNLEYLDTMGRLLYDRPGVRFKLCGLATEADREVLQVAANENMLEALAAQYEAALVAWEAQKAKWEAKQAEADKSSKRKSKEEAAQAESPDQPPEPPPILTFVGPPPPAVVPLEAMLDVAEKRGNAVKDYLVEHQVEPKRLILCSPDVAPDPATPPGVDVSL